MLKVMETVFSRDILKRSHSPPYDQAFCWSALGIWCYRVFNAALALSGLFLAARELDVVKYSPSFD